MTTKHTNRWSSKWQYCREMPKRRVCVGSVDICNLISISNVPIDKRTYPDSKRVDSVQCCSGRLRYDLSLADRCKGGTQPQVVEVVGCVWCRWWIWLWVKMKHNTQGVACRAAWRLHIGRRQLCLCRLSFRGNLLSSGPIIIVAKSVKISTNQFFVPKN